MVDPLSTLHSDTEFMSFLTFQQSELPNKIDVWIFFFLYE